MPASKASVTRQDDALVFAGALLRDDVSALWRQALPVLPGVRRIDLTGATQIDSAGLALLAELIARSHAGKPVTGEAVTDNTVAFKISGNPQGLSELCAAYRLTTDLDFATT